MLRLCICMLCGLLFGVPVGAAKTEPSEQPKKNEPAAKKPKTDAVQGDLAQIKQKIQQLSTALLASKEAKQDAHQALKASETAISESKKKLRAIQQAQQENRETLHALQVQMQQLSRKVTQQQQAIGKQLNQQYRHGQTSALHLWLQQQEPASIHRQLKYLGYLTRAHQQQIATLQVDQAEVDKIQDKTNRQVEKTDALAREYAQANQQLEQEKARRAQVLQTVTRQVETQQQQLSRLKKDEEALTQLMQKLLAEAKKRQQAQEAQSRREKKNALHSKRQEHSRPDRAATDAPRSGSDPSVRKNGRVFEHADQASVENSQASSNTVIAKNETLPEASEQQARFSELRGRLRLPVRGEVINRFGSPRSDTGVNWKGLFIRAQEGSEVKSVANGQIVFADWMRGFGNLIVVDHGDGYMSLYGNNEALYKGSGQKVRAGETIAAVGNSGGNTDNGVYYELRRNSVPFDPLQWTVLR